MTIAAIGQPVPTFELRDQHRNFVTSESITGRNTLLVFIPFPFTGVCGNEVCDLRDRLHEFDELDASVVAITCDTVAANKAWADQNRITYPVLSDFWPHGEASMAFGVFNEKLGCANRTTFVVDQDGIVRDLIASQEFGVGRESDHYITALRALAEAGPA